MSTVATTAATAATAALSPMPSFTPEEAVQILQKQIARRRVNQKRYRQRHAEQLSEARHDYYVRNRQRILNRVKAYQARKKAEQGLPEPEVRPLPTPTPAELTPPAAREAETLSMA